MNHPSLTSLIFVLAMLGTLAPALAADLVAGRDYWSIQLVSGRSIEALQEHYALAANQPHARIEQRGQDYILRVGFWDSKAEAERMLNPIRATFRGAFVRIAAYRPDSIIVSADKAAPAMASAAAKPAPAEAPSAEKAPANLSSTYGAGSERATADRDLQQFRQAIKSNDLKRARELVPNFQSRIATSRDARTASSVGWLYIDLDQPETAIVWFASVVEWQPSLQQGHLGLATANLRLNRLSKAEAALGSAKYTDPRVRSLRGDILFARAQEAHKQKQYAESLEYLKQAEGYGRRGRESALLRAWNYYYQGQDADAAHWFVSSYRMQPDRESAEGAVSSMSRSNRWSELAQLAQSLGGPLKEQWEAAGARR